MSDIPPEASETRRFRHIVVGAGAAGCVLAARLSEDADADVLLIEAGPDLLPGKEPASVLDPYPGSLFSGDFTWRELSAEVFAEGQGGAAVHRGLIQGKVVGGGSTINGMMAQRGLPWDFDAWEAEGAAGWGWEDVLPFFKALENDLDFSNDLHGDSGPIPIRREREADWPPFARAVTEAMIAEGYAYFEDSNGEFGDGVSPVPMNNLPDSRVSASIGYLNEGARRRPNLEILADTHVGRLLFDGTRCLGVEAVRDGRKLVFHADETIVTCGAVFSPTLLLRSGIGPAGELAARGIEVVSDCPGVGKNLHNHSMIHVATHLKGRAVQPADLASWAFTYLRYSSDRADCPAGDMQVFPINRTAWHPLGKRIGAIGLCLYQPFSTGEVTLSKGDPGALPSVRFNMLADERDVERLVDGLELVLRLLRHPEVARLRNEIFLPDKVMAGRMASPTCYNLALTSVIAGLLDLGGSVRRLLFGKSVLDPDRPLDRDRLRGIVRGATAHVHHLCGTCRMGDERDPMAVVDSHCQVHGVTGLRVADASIMPRNVSANTHLAVLMIGEKAASMIREGRPDAIREPLRTWG